MTNPCTINRAFYVRDGVRLEPGTVIDADTLPLAKQLISQRWLAPAPVNLKRCLVTRPFTHGDIELKFGDVVDASGWVNAELMIAQRFLSPNADENAPFKSACIDATSTAEVSVPEAIIKRGRGRPRKIRE